MGFFRKFFTGYPARPASLAGFSEAQAAGPGQFSAPGFAPAVIQPPLGGPAARCMEYLTHGAVLRVPFDASAAAIVRLPRLVASGLYDRAPWQVPGEPGMFHSLGVNEISVPWSVAAELRESGRLSLLSCHGHRNFYGWKYHELDGTLAEFWAVHQ
jgi:hypothetical protein